MMLSAAGAIVLLIAVMAVLGTLAWGALSAAPWVPLPRRDVARLLALAQLKPNELLYDLGSGDGRLVVAAAEQFGVRAIGFELALVPYVLAHLRRLRSPARSRISFRYRSFWGEHLTPATAVVCFLTPYAMRKLEPKLAAELAPGARFVSYTFKLPSRQPTIVSRQHATDAPIYLYT